MCQHLLPSLCVSNYHVILLQPGCYHHHSWCHYYAKSMHGQACLLCPSFASAYRAPTCSAARSIALGIFFSYVCMHQVEIVYVSR